MPLLYFAFHRALLSMNVRFSNWLSGFVTLIYFLVLYCINFLQWYSIFYQGNILSGASTFQVDGLFYAPLLFPLYFINGSFLACELVLAILRLGVPYCFLLSNLFSSQMFGDLPAAFVYVYMFYNFASFFNK